MKLYCIYLPLAILALAGVRPLRAESYTFRVAECGAYTAYPKGMNTHGTVVGGAQTTGLTYSVAFVYVNGECKTVSLGPTGTSFRGITDNGEILGLYGNLQNYLYDNGTFSGLPSYPGFENTYYCCLNASTGEFAGNYLMEGLEQYGFLYQNGIFTPLPPASTTPRRSLG